MSTDEPIDKAKRKFLCNAAAVVGGVGVASATIPFLAAMQPSAGAQAAGAPVSVDISQLKAGEKMTVEWRGKPVWIVRRTQEALAILDQEDETQLRDPNSDASEQPNYAKNRYRSLNPEYLVLIGICTHLGCAPIYRPDRGGIRPNWEGGFFCPCHGSSFDFSGRVFKGVPAPLNLQVPPYRFVSKDIMIIGEDESQG